MSVHSVSFLDSGPGFNVELPDLFGQDVEGAFPIEVQPGGGRKFVYVPPGLSENWNDERLSLEEAGTGPDGFEAEIWKRPESPTLWFVKWDLPGSYAVMHVREELEGFHAARDAINNVRIEFGSLDVPQVDLMGGWRSAASRVVGYKSELRFRAAKQDVGFVAFIGVFYPGVGKRKVVTRERQTPKGRVESSEVKTTGEVEVLCTSFKGEVDTRRIVSDVAAQIERQR